jgi:succinate dehydrogenase / fumarate reductase cytochrome b subunit
MTTVMTGVRTVYRSSIGKKAIMAITGLIYVLFVIGHMAGNLKIFLGQEVLNQYAGFLRTVGEPLFPQTFLLWIARIVLIVAIVLHVVMAYQLTRADWAARPVKYNTKHVVQASLASMTMRWGGIALLLFIIFHLLHFTFGVVGYGPAGAANAYIPESAAGGFSTYQNVVVGFQNILVVIIYILAMVALAFHLYHGSWSMFQTLGLNNTRYNGLWRFVATAIAVIVFVGNVSIPLAVITGIVR